MTPIIIFKNQKQAYEYLFYWRNLLGLQNWIISINLLYNEPCIAPNWGRSTNWRAMHVGEINIPMPKPRQINTFPMRYVQEDILVHELMHFLLPGIKSEYDTTESDYYSKETHATLESIAKSLIMARYRLPFEYFYNF